MYAEGYIPLSSRAMNALNPVQTVGEQIVEAMMLHSNQLMRLRDSGWLSCWRWSASAVTVKIIIHINFPVVCVEK